MKWIFRGIPTGNLCTEESSLHCREVLLPRTALSGESPGMMEGGSPWPCVDPEHLELAKC